MSRIIKYNLEDDDILDVLNDSIVTGLSSAIRWREQDENYMKICLFVLPEWNNKSEDIVKKTCYVFGEDYFIEKSDI